MRVKLSLLKKMSLLCGKKKNLKNVVFEIGRKKIITKPPHILETLETPLIPLLPLLTIATPVTSELPNINWK